MVIQNHFSFDKDEMLAGSVEQLKGPNSANAFHRLLEYEGDLAAFLIRIYPRETDVKVKAQIVEILWHRGNEPGILEFLRQAVKEEVPVIWKAAVDGLVSLGGYKALNILREMKLESHTHPDKLEWILEAIEQIEEQDRT